MSADKSSKKDDMENYAPWVLGSIVVAGAGYLFYRYKTQTKVKTCANIVMIFIL